MNSSKFDIDGYTKKLVNKGDVKQPGSNFTRNVMSQILKDPSLKVNFITKDDNQSNIWLLLSMGVMIIGYIIFFLIKNGFNFYKGADNFQAPEYLSAFAEFFSKFWNELSLSPYILLALTGVIILVVLDKTIVKYLYSI